MWLRTSCYLKFGISTPTPFIFMLRPRSGEHQWVAKEEYMITPHIPVHEFTDMYDNLCQRLLANPGTFTLSTSAVVKTPDYVFKSPGAPFIEIQNLPPSVFSYLLPSRYCESDRLLYLANSITANDNPGYDQVSSIERWLRDNVHYIPGSSDYPVSAIEVNQRRWGVCRDLAHLGITLCRSLSIPARMVVGYLYNLQPMDLHAWFEAYVGGHWHTFDAVHTGLNGGYVALGYGRDAADVAIYNQFGPPVYPMEQTTNVELIEE